MTAIGNTDRKVIFNSLLEQIYFCKSNKQVFTNLLLFSIVYTFLLAKFIENIGNDRIKCHIVKCKTSSLIAFTELKDAIRVCQIIYFIVYVYGYFPITKQTSHILSSHCVKSVPIRSFFWSEWRIIRTRENSVFGHFSYNVLSSK